MVKLNFSNFEKLSDEEQWHAKKQVNSFIEKMQARVGEIDTMNINLLEKRRRDGTYEVSEFSIDLFSKNGVIKSTASGWDKGKALRDAMEKIEKQVRRKH